MRSLLQLLLLVLNTCSSAFVPISTTTRHSSRSLQNYQALRQSKRPFTHEDIIWKIRPPPTATLKEKIKWKWTANFLRWDCLVRRQRPPTVLCPNNFPMIILEAHSRAENQKMGRFGITCVRGPSAPPIGETVQQLYNIDAAMAPTLGIAAIIYMVVEPPEFRGRDVGKLALEVISLIHAKANADFTILVADDKSGDAKTLVKWYEQQGFAQAPLLQDMMGSPKEEFGVSMIAPTNGSIPSEHLRIVWW